MIHAPATRRLPSLAGSFAWSFLPIGFAAALAGSVLPMIVIVASLAGVVR